MAPARAPRGCLARVAGPKPPPFDLCDLGQNALLFLASFSSAVKSGNGLTCRLSVGIGSSSPHKELGSRRE